MRRNKKPKKKKTALPQFPPSSDFIKSSMMDFVSFFFLIFSLCVASPFAWAWPTGKKKGKRRLLFSFFFNSFLPSRFVYERRFVSLFFSFFTFHSVLSAYTADCCCCCCCCCNVVATTCSFLVLFFLFSFEENFAAHLRGKGRLVSKQKTIEI